MCVCAPCSHRDAFFFQQGTLATVACSSPLMSLLPTKLLMSWEDIGADHSDVLAIFNI